VHRGQNNALTGSEAGNIFADGYDFPCDVAAQNVRQLHTWQSLAYPDIEMIQGAGFDSDENLILAWLRVGYVFVAKNFWATEFVYANGFHASLVS
jgi:hypothetical protein